MGELYPLLMTPYFDRRPWGVRDLAPIYDRHVHPGEQPIGEAWLTWDLCRVANGPFGGATLGELCARFGSDLVGASAREQNRFPLLVKFLFTSDKLSVQVHPDDPTARLHGMPCGKTECWYAVAAEPGAQVALGLKAGVTRAEFEQAIQNQRAEELLNWVEVHTGDMIYVHAGTVHTIGPGLILLETQQNSDATYRLYDYGRPRELHLRQGLEALKEHTRAGKVAPRGDAGMSTLISAPCFLVEKQRLERGGIFTGSNTAEWNTAEVLVGLDGAGVIEVPGLPLVTLARGDAVVIPACLPEFIIRAQWTVEFLAITLPPKVDVAEPETYLPGREALTSG